MSWYVCGLTLLIENSFCCGALSCLLMNVYFVGIGSSVAYAASKGALVTMTLSLARALGPIKVNAVCPGFIQGEWLQEGLGAEAYDKMKAKIEKSNPLGKTSTAEDIAKSIYFFAAEQQIITGETLIMDGGAHLAMATLSRR